MPTPKSPPGKTKRSKVKTQREFEAIGEEETSAKEASTPKADAIVR